MREIKFRTFVKTEDMDKGVMIYPKSNDTDFCMICNGDGFNVVYQSEKWLKDNEFLVMQYTGLKDKSGKEIYERDIVMAINYRCGAKEVLTVRYFMGNPCLCFKEQDTGTPLYPLIVTHSFEVIGNIYEHPHLLEVQK